MVCNSQNKVQLPEIAMNRLCWGCVLGVFLTCVRPGFASEKGVAPDLSQIKQPQSWSLLNAAYETTTKQGNSAVRLWPKVERVKTPSNIAMAVVEGLEFSEGTLEIDLKGRGKVQRCFLGLAFGVRDAKNFEAVYFRPFNFLREDDPSYRAHAVQYIAWPDNTWEVLRKGKPGQFESTVKPVPDPAGWFHARIEVTKKKVRVWVDDAKEPCLVVDRLASRERGKVGLWVDSGGGTFKNLKIRPAI
jgi:hypothetical protein